MKVAGGRGVKEGLDHEHQLRAVGAVVEDRGRVLGPRGKVADAGLEGRAAGEGDADARPEDEPAAVDDLAAEARGMCARALVVPQHGDAPRGEPFGQLQPRLQALQFVGRHGGGEVHRVADRAAGEEVAQLYLSTGDITPAVAMPVKQLRGFSKVLIDPGQTRQVTFTLGADELYIFDPDSGSYQVPTGSYTAQVGGASDKLLLSANFTLEAAPTLSDLRVTNIRTIPAFPVEGEKVHFVATLLNRGTAPTSADKPSVVSFRVNGRHVSDSPKLLKPIPAGGMALVCGSEGEPWVASLGTYSVRAEADAAGEIEETLESNNTATSIRSVRPKPVSVKKP